MMRHRGILMKGSGPAQSPGTGGGGGGGGGTTPGGSIVFDSTLNLVFDGNSLIAGQGGAQNIARCAAMISPIATTTSVGFLPAPTVVSGSSPLKYRSDKGILVSNFGVNGQKWRQMDGLDGSTAADVDGSFDATKVNVLVAWEWTNSIVGGGLSVTATAAAATNYVTNRRAAHPWAKIFTGTALPRMDQNTDQTAVNDENAKLDAMNDYIRANWQAMGFDGYFEVRPAGGYFDMGGDYSIAHFNAMAADSNSYWASSDPAGQHIHCNSNGYWYITTTFIVPMLVAA